MFTPVIMQYIIVCEADINKSLHPAADFKVVGIAMYIEELRPRCEDLIPQLPVVRNRQKVNFCLWAFRVTNNQNIIYICSFKSSMKNLGIIIGLLGILIVAGALIFTPARTFNPADSTNGLHASAAIFFTGTIVFGVGVVLLASASSAKRQLPE